MGNTIPTTGHGIFDRHIKPGTKWIGDHLYAIVLGAIFVVAVAFGAIALNYKEVVGYSHSSFWKDSPVLGAFVKNTLGCDNFGPKDQIPATTAEACRRVRGLN